MVEVPPFLIYLDELIVISAARRPAASLLLTAADWMRCLANCCDACMLSPVPASFLLLYSSLSTTMYCGRSALTRVPEDAVGALRRASSLDCRCSRRSVCCYWSVSRASLSRSCEAAAISCTFKSSAPDSVDVAFNICANWCGYREATCRADRGGFTC